MVWTLILKGLISAEPTVTRLCMALSTSAVLGLRSVSHPVLFVSLSFVSHCFISWFFMPCRGKGLCLLHLPFYSLSLFIPLSHFPFLTSHNILCYILYVVEYIYICQINVTVSLLNMICTFQICYIIDSYKHKLLIFALLLLWTNYIYIYIKYDI